MSIRKLTLLGSNLASLQYLKRNQTPHSLCFDFGGDKTFTTRWSGCRVQVWVQVWAPAGRLAISQILSDGCSRGNRRFRGKINGQALGAALQHSLGGTDDGRAGTNTSVSELAPQLGGSRCRPRPARLRKICCHSCHTDSVQESKRF